MSKTRQIPPEDKGRIRVRRYAYTVGLCATAFVVWRIYLVRELLLSEILPVSIFSLFIGFAWYFSFSIFPRASLSISLDMAYLLTAMCVLPRPLPLAVALAGSVIGCSMRARDSSHRQNPFLEVLGLNTGGIVLVTIAGGAISVQLAEHWQFQSMNWWTVTCVVALFLIYNLVNLAVMSVAVALKGEPLMPYLAQYLRYMPSLEVFTIPLCLGLALLYTASGIWGFMTMATTILLASGLLKRLNLARTELTVTNEQLQTRSRELATLNTIGREISTSLDPWVVVTRISSHVQRILDAPFLFLSLYHPGLSDFYVEFIAREGKLQPRPERELGKGFTTWMIEAQRPILVEDLHVDRDTLACAPLILDPSVRSILAAPLIVNSEAVGVLCVESPRPNAYTIDQLSVFTTIAQQGAVAIENARNYELATVDQLTGLFLRDYFYRKLSEEQVRARRYGSTFALLMLDLDSFKEINDSLGHLAGDRYLRRVGKVIRETMRGADVACRYGGEEFAIVLPETDLTGAVTIGERIRKRIARMEVPAGDELMRTTVSIGIAIDPTDFTGTRPGLLDRGDQALYAA
ncbi:MAG: sensor domain-containing diguanylate cyclase [Acidobacteria bacterium]|nr:sensor domain-containing diguanylate cyclase [Acidobacteriota bacterium]